jgi:hypothetical protein
LKMGGKLAAVAEPTTGCGTVNLASEGIVNLSRGGILAVGGAAVRCREAFGTPIGLPPLKKKGPRRSTRPS